MKNYNTVIYNIDNLGGSGGGISEPTLHSSVFISTSLGSFPTHSNIIIDHVTE